MTRLPDLHRHLVEAARRQEAQAASDEQNAAGRSRLRAAPAWARGRLRLLALTTVGILASTTAALAAGGVIPIGSPVPPDKSLHRESGVGVPVRSGATKLLALRAPDPRGGPPWGMRIVRTSREEVCLQIGRVAHGRLGELGIDGAFHNDGELHPRPASSLPARPPGGLMSEASNQNTECTLAGQAVSVADPLVPSSAAALRLANPHAMASLEAIPRRELRNVYYGLLGPQAVSVTYRAGGATHTEPVAAGGAYLIVRPLRAGQSLRDFGTSSGAPYGQLTPGPGRLIEKFTYRIKGRLCERGLHWERTPVGAWRSTGAARGVAHPCPSKSEPPPPAGPRRLHRPALVDMHRPVHAHIHVHGGVVTAITITFKAPYPVRSARDGYSLFLPERPCHLKKGEIEVEGGELISLDRNVRRGALVSYTLRHHPLTRRYRCRAHTLIVKPVYEHGEERTRRTFVGAVTVRLPPGTRAR